MNQSMRHLLSTMADRNATDLHLTRGSRPVYRVAGQLCRTDMPVLEAEDCESMIFSLLTDHQREVAESQHELDCSVHLDGIGRFRVNIYYQKGCVGAALRLLPEKVPDFDQLGLPAETMKELAGRESGLIIVTGPTGSGKSTTQAAIIDYINRHMSRHIMCLEDPIEYLHEHRQGLVNQRELGHDTEGFDTALRHVLRQDPDVVQIGEMRDLETMRSALTVAETGHLALSTLHTRSATKTLGRIIDAFPPHQQAQVHVQLANVLTAVIAQQLVPRADGKGLALAYEILVAIPAIRNLVKEGELGQIYSHLQMGEKNGMITLNRSLARLVEAGEIRERAARRRSLRPENMDKMLEKCSRETRDATA